MPLDKLLAAESYDPAQIKIMRQVFDAVWTRIGSSVTERRGAIDAARLKLANVVLHVAKAEFGTAEGMTEKVLVIMFRSTSL